MLTIIILKLNILQRGAPDTYPRIPAARSWQHVCTTVGVSAQRALALAGLQDVDIVDVSEYIIRNVQGAFTARASFSQKTWSDNLE